MEKQIFMQLKDSVLRPKLTKDKINKENASFKRVLQKYINWCKQEGDDQNIDEYTKDICMCIDQFNLDGYELAKYLEDYCGIMPDSELVNILDNIFFVKNDLTNEMLKSWVDENFLTIPEDVKGKKVNVTSGYNKYNNVYITTIKPDTYQVTVDEDPARKGGWVIDFENIKFID